MYKVIFQNSRQEEREIGTAADMNGADDVIDKFLDEHNFEIYYRKVWKENGRTKVDVGSWSEFFYVEECED